VSVDFVKYISIYYGKGSKKVAKCLAQYITFRSGQGIFADESVRACAARMPAYKWWASWEDTLLEIRAVAMRALAQPVGAGAGERNWSTYGFIVDKRKNRLAVDRDRKLMYVYFNVRLLRKVRAV
jgi:hypothetical protein